MNSENVAILAMVITSAFVITFSCINNAVSKKKKECHVNPLTKTRPQTLDGDLFSDRVWAGPLGWVIYLCLVGKSIKSHNINPHPSQSWHSRSIRLDFTWIFKKKININSDVSGPFPTWYLLNHCPSAPPLSSAIPHSQTDKLQLSHGFSRKCYYPVKNTHTHKNSNSGKQGKVFIFNS